LTAGCVRYLNRKVTKIVANSALAPVVTLGGRPWVLMGPSGVPYSGATITRRREPGLRYPRRCPSCADSPRTHSSTGWNVPWPASAIPAIEPEFGVETVRRLQQWSAEHQRVANELEAAAARCCRSRRAGNCPSRWTPLLERPSAKTKRRTGQLREMFRRGRGRLAARGRMAGAGRPPRPELTLVSTASLRETTIRCRMQTSRRRRSGRWRYASPGSACRDGPA